MNASLFKFMGVLALLVLWAVRTFAIPSTYSLINGDQDFILYNDVGAPHYQTQIVGDFNGDGKMDLAFHSKNGSVFIALGFTDFNGSKFKDRVACEIIFSSSQYTNVGTGDLNGDGRDDLIFTDSKYRPASANIGRVFIVFGRTQFPAQINLFSGGADLIISGTSTSLELGQSHTIGDINGDGYVDLILESNVYFYVFFGNSTFPSSIDLNVDPADFRIRDPDYRGGAQLMDLNGDGIKDIVISHLLKTFSTRTDCGEISIIFGTTTFPSTWDLSTRAPDKRIWGSTVRGYLSVSGTGDVTGDGRDDLYIRNDADSRFVDGMILNSAAPTVDLLSGQSNSIPTIPSLLPSSSNAHFGQFDGISGLDAIVKATWELTSPLQVYATLEPGAAPYLSTPSVVILPSGNLSLLGVHDIDGDGLGDILMHGDASSLPPGGPYYGAFYIFFGYRPLRQPSLYAQASAANVDRVELTLGIEGPAAEMRLSGDIEAAFKDQWIPYATKKSVTLTGLAGMKTMTATFRNALKRESDPVSRPITLDLTQKSLRPRTNRLREGREVVFDASLPGPGHARATLYSMEGRSVRRIMNQDVNGSFSLRWDGTDDDGKRVAAGVYVLVMDLDGDIRREKVFVEPQ